MEKKDHMIDKLVSLAAIDRPATFLCATALAEAVVMGEHAAARRGILEKGMVVATTSVEFWQSEYRCCLYGSSLAGALDRDATLALAAAL